MCPWNLLHGPGSPALSVSPCGPWRFVAGCLSAFGHHPGPPSPVSSSPWPPGALCPVNAVVLVALADSLSVVLCRLLPLADLVSRLGWTLPPPLAFTGALGLSFSVGFVCPWPFPWLTTGGPPHSVPRFCAEHPPCPCGDPAAFPSPESNSVGLSGALRRLRVVSPVHCSGSRWFDPATLAGTEVPGLLVSPPQRPVPVLSEPALHSATRHLSVRPDRGALGGCVVFCCSVLSGVLLPLWEFTGRTGSLPFRSPSVPA